MLCDVDAVADPEPSDKRGQGGGGARKGGGGGARKGGGGGGLAVI